MAIALVTLNAMQTLVDLFELNAPLSARASAPAPASHAHDGRSTLVDIEIDWEETFHGAQHGGSTRGARVWSSEE
jgi:hypothetical protein